MSSLQAPLKAAKVLPHLCTALVVLPHQCTALVLLPHQCTCLIILPHLCTALATPALHPTTLTSVLSCQHPLIMPAQTCTPNKATYSLQTQMSHVGSVAGMHAHKHGVVLAAHAASQH